MQFCDGLTLYLGVVNLQLLQRDDVFDGRQTLHVGVVDEKVLQLRQTRQWLQRFQRRATCIQSLQVSHLRQGVKVADLRVPDVDGFQKQVVFDGRQTADGVVLQVDYNKIFFVGQRLDIVHALVRDAEFLQPITTHERFKVLYHLHITTDADFAQINDFLQLNSIGHLALISHMIAENVFPILVDATPPALQLWGLIDHGNIALLFLEGNHIGTFDVGAIGQDEFDAWVVDQRSGR